MWEAIAKEYNDLCEAGRSGLTAADARGSSALIAKFNKYLNDFKKWADKANRAHARSGVQADEGHPGKICEPVSDEIFSECEVQQAEQEVGLGLRESDGRGPGINPKIFFLGGFALAWNRDS